MNRDQYRVNELDEFLVKHEVIIRSGVFLGMLMVMAGWESRLPRRTCSISKSVRWLNNIGLILLNSVLLRILFPTAAAGVALFCQRQGWGILNIWPLPTLLGIIVAVIVLDLAIYLQHVMFHAVPVLWRVHRVHHADLDFDVTTGLRFHPIEIILSMLIKFSVIVVTGAPVSAVVLFEVILNAMSMFSHGNVRLPAPVDKWLRYLIVTPEMHRVHHSVEDDETNSNFGFNLSLWDRLFGTYRAQPRAGHAGMTIGIRTFRDSRRCVSLAGLLTLPFIGKVTDYAINRRTWS